MLNRLTSDGYRLPVTMAIAFATTMISVQAIRQVMGLPNKHFAAERQSSV